MGNHRAGRSGLPAELGSHGGYTPSAESYEPMTTEPNHRGSLSGEGLRIGIVVSRFNSPVVERLLDGAREFLRRNGIGEEDVETFEVPGAWEIPLALDRLAAAGRFDGLVALGAVIRGETPHFEYVSSGCAEGILRVSLDHGIPVGFGVLTCDTGEQAMARAGGEKGNKGREAAEAALEMVNLLKDRLIEGSA
ncbi:MAG: 6,7-dimethyl-8-ribityllumazine synthase [Thermoanaerobaculia bacterium]|nr:6,7-dimethyl-8-ribityllumazine synthase [Thermoanaerobaculia bacterium]